jgi:hypothetical protein
LVASLARPGGNITGISLVNKADKIRLDPAAMRFKTHGKNPGDDDQSKGSMPRADRDSDMTPAPAGVPPKTERQSGGVALKVHTVLGAREVSVQHSPRHQPPSEPAGAQRHPIKAEVSPTSERDTGFVFHGEFSVEAGQLRVYDMRGRLLGSSPLAAGDDPCPLARRILRQKSIGGTGDFWAPLPARRDSFH